MVQAILTRRQTLAEVRSQVRCHYYEGYIIGLQWNPGKGEYDWEFGNVTGYLTEPGGKSYTLPFRIRLTANYEEEILNIVENCKIYVQKVEVAASALEALHTHRFPF
jgi:hypothetical protein